MAKKNSEELTMDIRSSEYIGSISSKGQPSNRRILLLKSGDSGDGKVIGCMGLLGVESSGMKTPCISEEEKGEDMMFLVKA